MNLTQQQIDELAAKHGLDPSEREVTANAAQANACHGRQSRTVSWSTDDRGVVDAYRLLDGLLEQVVQERRADERSDRDFRRNAYGE